MHSDTFPSALDSYRRHTATISENNHQHTATTSYSHHPTRNDHPVVIVNY